MNARISTREIEVLDLISRGFTDKEISHKLFLSPHTIKDHRKNILSKMKCRNAPSVVRKAIELGLLPIIKAATELKLAS